MSFISFICSPDKVSIGNLLRSVAYFQSLASNSSTDKHQLPLLMGLVLLSMMIKLIGQSEPWSLYPTGIYLNLKYLFVAVLRKVF